MSIRITLTKQFITVSPVYFSAVGASFIYGGYSWSLCNSQTNLLYLTRFNYKTGELVLFEIINTNKTAGIAGAFCIKKGFIAYNSSSYFIKIPLPLGQFTNLSITPIKAQISAYDTYSQGFFDSFNGIAEEVLSNGNGTWVHNALYLFSSTPTVVNTSTTDSTAPVYVNLSKPLINQFFVNKLATLINYCDADNFSYLEISNYNINMANRMVSASVDSQSYSSISFNSGIMSCGLGTNNFIFTNGALITPIYNLYCDGTQTNNCTAVIDSGIWATMISGSDFYSYSTNQPVPFNFNLQNSNVVINHNRPISTTGHFLT